MKIVTAIEIFTFISPNILTRGKEADTIAFPNFHWFLSEFNVITGYLFAILMPHCREPFNTEPLQIQSFDKHFGSAKSLQRLTAAQVPFCFIQSSYVFTAAKSYL